MFLRQSTTSQEIQLGPFLDATDGDTTMTGLTIANTDIKIWKHGATTVANKNSGGATHMSGGQGMYSAVLDDTDTDTLGMLEVSVHVATALAVLRRFVVLPAQVYDSLILGSDKLQVHTDELTAALITSTVLADNAITANKIASNAIAAAKIADDALTAAKFATDSISADALAADAIAEIQTGVADPAAIAAAVLTADYEAVLAATGSPFDVPRFCLLMNTLFPNTKWVGIPGSPEKIRVYHPNSVDPAASIAFHMDVTRGGVTNPVTASTPEV